MSIADLLEIKKFNQNSDQESYALNQIRR